MLTIRRLTDRFPSTLAEDALTEFLRDGHFSAHIKRARKRVKAARDALVAALRSDRLTVSVPEQGLHLVAELDGAEDDAALVHQARAVGFGVKALSPLYAGPTERRGW